MATAVIEFHGTLKETVCMQLTKKRQKSLHASPTLNMCEITAM